MTFHLLDIRACNLRWNREWISKNLQLILRSEEYAIIHFKDAFTNQPEFMAGFGEP